MRRLSAATADPEPPVVQYVGLKGAATAWSDSVTRQAATPPKAP